MRLNLVTFILIVLKLLSILFKTPEDVSTEHTELKKKFQITPLNTVDDHFKVAVFLSEVSEL